MWPPRNTNSSPPCARPWGFKIVAQASKLLCRNLLSSISPGSTVSVLLRWIEHPNLTKFPRRKKGPPSPQGRVALLGFAYRHISVKFTPKARNQPPRKPLPTRVKTISDWISVKLRENGMSSFHLGAKMGIATSVVNAWKDGLARPQNRQMREMVTILGTYRHGSSDVIAVRLS